MRNKNCPKRFVGEEDEGPYLTVEEAMQNEENEESIG